LPPLPPREPHAVPAPASGGALTRLTCAVAGRPTDRSDPAPLPPPPTFRRREAAGPAVPEAPDSGERAAGHGGGGTGPLDRRAAA